MLHISFHVFPKSRSCQELFTHCIGILGDIACQNFQGFKYGLPSTEGWHIDSISSLIDFLAKGGDPAATAQRAVDLLSGLGLLPSLVVPTLPVRGAISLMELGISDTQFILAPKFHAVVSLIPAVLDKSIFEAVTPTVTLPTATDPFQCMILQGANQVAAVQVVLFIAALMKAAGSWMPPPQLLEIASAIPVTFVIRPSSRLTACILSNRLTMGAAHTSRISKPTLWDLRTQVLNGGGFDIED
jgi:hypothetical protein